MITRSFRFCYNLLTPSSFCSLKKEYCYAHTGVLMVFRRPIISSTCMRCWDVCLGADPVNLVLLGDVMHSAVDSFRLTSWWRFICFFFALMNKKQIDIIGRTTEIWIWTNILRPACITYSYLDSVDKRGSLCTKHLPYFNLVLTRRSAFKKFCSMQVGPSVAYIKLIRRSFS